jgi:hypothetical protein
LLSGLAPSSSLFGFSTEVKRKEVADGAEEVADGAEEVAEVMAEVMAVAEVAVVAGAEIEDMRISKWPQKKEKKSTSNS